MRKAIFLHPFYVRWPKKILGRRAWSLLGVILAVTFVCFLFYINYIRGKGLFDAFSIALPFFLGEYSDIPEPEKFGPLGTLIVLILFIIGTVFVVSIIGKIASVFVNLKMGEKKPEKLKDHIVICNWNDRGDLIIKEIHSDLAAPKTEIIIITEKRINEQELRSNPAYEKVYLLRKEPTSHEVLEEARAHLAKSVIILADKSSKDPDAKTALISLAIRKLKKDSQEKAVSQKKPYIIAEVTSHQKIQHLKDAGVTEWICCTDYGLGIIAQCALKAKLSKVYEELLKYSEKTNEIYLVASGQYPKSFGGMSFKEASGIMNEKKDSQNPPILLGMKRGDDVILNPRGEKFNIEEGDSLIVMAYKSPDLTYLETK